MMVCVICGPEADCSHFEQAGVAFQKVSGGAGTRRAPRRSSRGSQTAPRPR
jgi:hypothetical protein